MVYYLNEEERKEIEALARELEVDDEFRGWSYKNGPMKPPYNIRIPLYIIASNIQFSSREEFEELQKLNITNPRKEMVLGNLLHASLVAVVEEAKKFVYAHPNTYGNELYNYLIDIREKKIDSLRSNLRGVASIYANDFIHYLNRLWYFESLQISSSLDRVLSSRIYNIDLIIQKAIPFVLEYEINGSKIGLSEKIKADGFGNLTIFELKSGKKNEYHKLATTGYALAMESMLEHPINVGCLVYISFDEKKATPIIKREIHPIEESLRRWFVDERDKKMELLYS